MQGLTRAAARRFARTFAWLPALLAKDSNRRLIAYLRSVISLPLDAPAKQETTMRLVVVTGIVGIFFGQIAALAQDGPPATTAPTLPAGISATLADLNGYRVATIAAGGVVGVIAANILTGGMISPLLAIGPGSAATAPVTAGVAFFAVREVVWHGFVLVSGPAAVVSVGAPVDAALRDGYTTPSTLAVAFGESARRARDARRWNAGTYLGEKLGSWWARL